MRNHISYRGYLPLLLVLVAVGVSYSNVLTGEFMFDDDRAINQNPLVKDLRGFCGSLSPSSLFVPAQRAMTTFTFAVNYALGGKSVVGFHAVNIFIHMVMAVAVYFFVLRMFGEPPVKDRFADRRGPALLLTAVFALHPIQTQAVSYIAQRSEVLSSLFYLLALHCLISFSEGGGKRAAGFYLLGIVSFLLGWMNKEVVVTVPAAFLLYICFFKGREALKKAVLGMLPVFIAVVVLGIIGITSLRGSREVGFNADGIGQPEYFYTGLTVLVRYLRLLVVPSGLTLDHDVPIYGEFLTLPVAGAFFLWVCLAVLGLWSLRMKGRWAAHLRISGFGILWYLLILLPSSLALPIIDVMYEHRVYLAMLGVALVFVMIADIFSWYAAEKLKAPREALLRGLFLAILITLSFATYERNSVWRTKVALWSDAVSKSPMKSRPHYNLAGSYYLAKNYQAALGEYLIAEKLGHDNIMLYYDLAITYGQLGRRSEAETYYRKFMAEKKGR